jgi:hypothetical protein
MKILRQVFLFSFLQSGCRMGTYFRIATWLPSPPPPPFLDEEYFVFLLSDAKQGRAKHMNANSF